jgi:hypothetical protein
MTPSHPAVHLPASPPQGQASFETLMAFGALAVAVMVFCYCHERRFPSCAIGTAAGCVMAGAYAFAQGAWPVGIAEGVWAIAAARRWLARPARLRRPLQNVRTISLPPVQWDPESRLTRMFGPR